MKEEEMYRNVLAESKLEFLPKVQEIEVRKNIRKEIREILKFERMADRKPGDSSDSLDESSGEENMDRRIEEKVQFGSDSDNDIDEYVATKDTPNYPDHWYDDELEYDEEGEFEYEEETEGDQTVSDMEFENVSASRYTESLSARRKKDQNS